MSLDTYCYPFIKSSSRVCCFLKKQAEGHIEREGGELIEVPTFETKEETEEWIKQKPDSHNWDIGFLEQTLNNPEIVYCVIRGKLGEN